MQDQQEIRYALTHPQQRIWYSEQLHPGTAMWNNAGTLKIKGVLDYALLETAINIFLRDNESIRIRVGVKDSVPYQYIEDYRPQSIDFLDFSDREVKKLYEWDSLQTQAPMPMIDSSLYYCALIKLSEHEGWLYAKFHHIISDALSIVEFSNQVMETYQVLLKGSDAPPCPRPSYVDFVRDEEAYLHSKRFLYDQQYWAGKFEQLPEPTIIKQKKTNYFGTAAKRKAFVIPAKLSAQIRGYCEDTGISVFSLFLSALAVYINRITNKKDIIIGAPVANRTSLHAKGAFGMFVSTVPIRIHIQDDLPFTEFTQVVSNDWFSALKHQKYPYDQLLQDLRKTHMGLESLYDVTLSYQIGKFHKNTEQFTYEGRWHFSGHQANPLCIHVNDREDEGRFIVDYDHLSPFFSAKEVEYIHIHLLSVIRDMIGHPEKPLYMLELMEDEERERVLVRFNNTDRAFPQGETLADLWYASLCHLPADAVAAVCQGQSMTYKELEARSTALALHLVRQGVAADSVVGVMVSRTFDYCISVLAVIKAGGAFLPIDADLPKERIAYMLEDSGAKVVLASPQLVQKCPSGLSVVSTGMPLALPNAAHAMPTCRPGDLAYVIYTSGSTGQPKGVQIEHRSIVHFVHSMREIWDFSPGARLLCAASFSFDISVMELLLAVTNGAVLVLAQEHEINIPRNMVRLIQSAEVNMLVVTPGKMELLLSDPQGPACLKNFREIGMGGDVLSEKLLARVQSCTRARIMNFYGPTEITICCTCTDVTHAKVPNIGRPMANVKAYILDTHKNPVPIGVPGELYVGGRGVSRGYIGKPELSSERFIDNPFLPGGKLYRTGDLARWYPLGEIEFLGRIDMQVKIRGYRIELGEIENRLMQVPGVTACAVADREDADGRKFLCAYLCGNPPSKADIKAQLVRDLPGYMIPSYFIVIDRLPFNASGKVDKTMLPDPLEGSDVLGSDYTSPKTKTEQMLAEIWAGTLNVQQIGRDDSFFDIGGDSLSIVKMMAMVLQTFHVDIALEDVYRSPRLRDLAALIDKAERCTYRPVVPVPDAPDYPVSSAQQRMWILAQEEGGSLAYHIPIAFSLSGTTDIPRLQRAINRLIARHEALRTSFALHDGELRQMVHEKAELTLETLPCETKRLASVLRGLMRPFDMRQAPLMHAAVIETDQDERILFIDMHHSIGDMRSAQIMLADIADFYAGREPARKKLEYRDYAVWQQQYLSSESISLQRAFWQDALAGELPMLSLHTDRPRPAVQRFEGARFAMDIGRKTADALRDFAGQRGATLFMAVLAAYNVLLMKYTGQEDIIVGTPVAGRSRREVEDIVGVFINTLPLRNYPRGDISFSQFFESLCEKSVAALAHADLPLERIIADAALPRDPSRNPLFDTMLVMARDTFELRLDDVRCAHYLFDPGIAKLDLTLEVYETGDGLHCEFEYSTRLFRKTTIRRMAEHLRRLIELLPEMPDTRLCDVAMLTQQEIWQVTQGFNQTDLSLKTERGVPSVFEETAAANADKTALIVAGQRMSFSALNARANRIARRLREGGVGRNTIVALCIRRSFDMVAALFGVLKAGGGYLPLDPSYPSDRNAFMLSDSGAKVLLTDGSADIAFDGQVFYVQDIENDGECGNLPPIDRPEDAAYVIYTSGSTGVPKGAILPRRALYNLYEGTKTTIEYDPEQTSVSVTTVTFDIFVIDALMPLLFGCTVVLCTEEELRQPHLLAALIEENDVRFIQTTPTRMRILMGDRSFRAAAAKHIQKIVLGGEEFPLSLLRLLKKYTNARLISGYGPTETTVYCTFKDLSHTSHITIGRPICNTRMYILDQYRRPVPIGVLGEAFISGACVTTGYIGRDELNRKKLVPDPYWPGQMMYQSGDICAFMKNGEMEIRGRIDHQVKIRGLRIELGEIEAALREVDGIGEAVVKDWGEGEKKYLCAYYASGCDIGADALRAHLLKKLPSYMIPSYFVGMRELPLTLNGKVNRKALTEPDREPLRSRVQTQDAPLSETEKKMAALWSRVLKVDDIGPKDSFFALGGDSLGVIKVQAAMLQYGWTVRTQDFFDHPTLRGICACLNDKKTNVKNVRLGALEEKRNVKIPEYAHLRDAGLRRVLLTGATGYLGAHILERLVQAPDAHVYCLVRGSDEKACQAHLREVLIYYFGLEKYTDMLGHITVMRCDVSQAGLGLDARALEQAADVQTVIHCAAVTDHAGRTEAFERVNVSGTRNVVAFARRTGAMLLHMSTVSVSGTHFPDDLQRRGVLTEDHYYIGQNWADNEYVKSKFLAEGIVFDAIEQGMNARIFRVGVLTGTMDGRFQLRPEKNAFANRIKALCEMGCAPIGMLGARVEMTPVDACAQAILALCAMSGVKKPVHHVFNTETMTLADMIGLLEQNGYRIRVLPDAEFERLAMRISQAGGYAQLSGLMEDIGTRRPHENILIGADATLTLLSEAGFQWPVIDARYMAQFISSIHTRVSKES